jgi:hypothetical protein
MANLARKIPAKRGIQSQAFSAGPISADTLAISDGSRVVKR